MKSNPKSSQLSVISVSLFFSNIIIGPFKILFSQHKAIACTTPIEVLTAAIAFLLK